MNPQLYSVPGPWSGRLAISPRPRGGDWIDDEVRSWRSAGVDVVVSLLSKEEEEELRLTSEGRLAAKHGIRFISFPIPDMSVPPSVTATVTVLQDLRAELGAGKNVVVHCRQGIGRSALITAGILIDSGMDPRSAIERIGAARGVPVPETAEQRAWLERTLADALALARR